LIDHPLADSSKKLASSDKCLFRCVTIYLQSINADHLMLRETLLITFGIALAITPATARDRLPAAYTIGVTAGMADTCEVGYTAHTGNYAHGLSLNPAVKPIIRSVAKTREFKRGYADGRKVGYCWRNLIYALDEPETLRAFGNISPFIDFN